MPAVRANLVRKQIMLSHDNIEKLEGIANKKGASVAEIVRSAVDAYNPTYSDMGDDELMRLVSKKLRSAIAQTQQVRKKLNKTFKQLGIN